MSPTLKRLLGLDRRFRTFTCSPRPALALVNRISNSAVAVRSDGHERQAGFNFSSSHREEMGLCLLSTNRNHKNQRSPVCPVGLPTEHLCGFDAPKLLAPHNHSRSNQVGPCGKLSELDFLPVVLSDPVNSSKVRTSSPGLLREQAACHPFKTCTPSRRSLILQGKLNSNPRGKSSPSGAARENYFPSAACCSQKTSMSLNL